MLTVRRAEESDFDALWEIFRQVVAGGDSFTFDEGTTRGQAHAFWMESEGAQTYVALLGDEVVGAYLFKPNQPGRGSHVANAAYMVKPGQRGHGVGRVMCEHSLEAARAAGFLAMQFNIVVSTNESAVALWRKLGFSIVGTLPKAFRHGERGLVDAFVMHRFL
jgi:ribosomal protein S18 acetylase RimI-like enzyme